MNLRKLKALEGHTIRLVPPPRRQDERGVSVDDKNRWHFLRLRDDTAEFVNAISDHRLTLETSLIRQFEEPDFLILKGQVTLNGPKVDFEPFRPEPATTAAKADLHLCLHGGKENGTVVLSALDPDPLRFDVINRGSEDVPNFRITLFLPEDFTRMLGADPRDFGKWKNKGKKEIDGLNSTIFECFIADPIYKNELLKMDVLPLQAPAGKYRILWLIRCKHGTFPNDSPHGEIRIRIMKGSETIKAADRQLNQQP